MRKLFTKKTIIILGLVVLVAFLFAVFTANTQPTLSIISSDPPTNTKNVSLGRIITLRFNQEVQGEILDVQSIPEEKWEISNKNPTTITLAHKLAFHPSTEYVVTLYSKNKLIGTLAFTTEKSQGDIRLIQTIEEKMKIDYPLSKQTPLIEPGYSVVYSAPLTLEITIKNPNLTTAEVVDEVKSWVTENGGDASTHKYIIATPSPSPIN